MDAQKEQEKKSQQTGITLIALVITVIILIILAGITIGAIIEKDGLITKSIESKVEYEKAQYIEQIEIARHTVAIDHLGVVTLDNLIEQIYQNEVVPRGNITKQDEESAKMITKEGYEFIITADGTEYIGSTGENLEISKPVWNSSTHTASVTITKGSRVEESIQVQYQVNGYAEDSWTTGTIVSNLKHNDTIYARLWDGTNGRNYTSQVIKDGTAPDVSIDVTNITTNSIAIEITAVDNQYGMPVEPEYIVSIKKSSDNRWTTQTIKNTTYTFESLAQNTSYTIKVETTDKAKNLGIVTKEASTETVTVANGNVTISLPTWNPTTHTASVIITKASEVASNLQIQYQVNGYAEDSWITGTTASNLKHNDTVYVRLWDGANGGDYTSQEIKDGTAPNVSIDVTNSTTNSIAIKITAIDNQYGMPVEPEYIVSIKKSNDSNWTTQTIKNTIYTFENLEQNTSYIIKVETIDKAGNPGIETKETSTETVKKLITGISLNISTITMNVGDTEILMPTITPTDATNKDINWSSNNPDIASVNNSGVVTAVNEGNAIITAEAKDESGIKAICNVTVVKNAVISDLKAGDYIKYDTEITSVGENGVITCRVLYPSSSQYGLQIIADRNVGEDITLGGNTWQEAGKSYNNAFVTLNSEAEKYVNRKYAYDGRSVGSLPTTKNGIFSDKNTGNQATVKVPTYFTKVSGTLKETRDTGFYDSDTNYTMDETILRNSNLLVTAENYWYASRYAYVSSTTVNSVITGSIYYINDTGKRQEGQLWAIYQAGAQPGYTVSRGLRPCFSLKSNNIKITGGDGTSEATAYTIEKVRNGIINIGEPIWDETTHTASVNITKGSGVGSDLQIQYQVNGYAENAWTTGSTVSNLKHNDIIYARLWNGITGENDINEDVKDSTRPNVSIDVTSTTTNSIAIKITAVDNQSGMPEEPEYVVSIKKSSDDNWITQTIKSTTYTFESLVQDTSYSIKVETKDKARNLGTGTVKASTGAITVASGNINLGAPVWNPTTHTASISITKGNEIASDLQIQYQVNGYAEDAWITGTTVANLNHNDTLYARLWDGINGGDYTSQDIKDSEDPKDATISWISKITLNISVQVILRDDETGVDIENSKWALTDSKDTIGIDGNYEGAFTGTNTTQIIKTNKSTAGTYFLHILTQDIAGRKKETICQVEIIENPNWSETFTNTEKDNYEDETGKKATIPKGFQVSTKEGEKKIDDGLVVRDATTKNEYVWVPCSSDGADSSIKYDRHTFLSTQVAKGTDSKTKSAKIYISSTSSYYFTEAMSSEELNSIEKYGGFYIGRYEVGCVDYDSNIETVNSGLSRNWTGYNNGTAVVQKGKQVWNYVTRNKAKEIAEGMLNGNDAVFSRLCSSYAWFTTLKFIEIKYPTYATRSEQGNYKEMTLDYIDLNGIQQTKKKDECVLLPTGQTTPVNNIFDMGGNCDEWVSETYSLKDCENTRVGRGLQWRKYDRNSSWKTLGS